MESITHIVYTRTMNVSVNKDGSVTLWKSGAPASDTLRVKGNEVVKTK